MFEKIFHRSKITRFFIIALGAYCIWFITYDFILKPYTLLDETVIKNIIQISSLILGLFYHTIYSSTENIDLQMIGIDGAHPVWIGEPCNGVSVMAFFLIFILAFPGKIKNKLWFIPTGIVIIHFVNILRVCALASIQYFAPDQLDFNHNYTFTIIVYTFVFSLWMLWVNRFSGINHVKDK